MSGFQLGALQAVSKAFRLKDHWPGISGSRSQTGHRRSRLASSSSRPLPDLRVVLEGFCSPTRGVTPRRLSSFAKRTSGSISEINIPFIEPIPPAADRNQPMSLRKLKSLAGNSSGSRPGSTPSPVDLSRSRSLLSIGTHAAMEGIHCPIAEFGQLDIRRKIGDGFMGQVRDCKYTCTSCIMDLHLFLATVVEQS